MLKRLLTALTLSSLTAAPAAYAGMYISGSVATQATTLPFQSTTSQYGSASVDIDLGHYIRLGYTYGIEKSSTQGYKSAKPDAATTDPTCSSCEQTYNNTTEIDHSIGLTIILYEGQVFMPFLLGGVIDKFLTVESRDYQTDGSLATKGGTSTTGPGPYGGGGIGIRINKDFMLKFSYQVSQGAAQLPNDPKAKHVLDARSTVGLTYQFM